MISDQNISRLLGADVVDADGDKIGSIGQIYVDPASGQPNWATVKTGFFGMSESFVPLDQALRSLLEPMSLVEDHGVVLREDAGAVGPLPERQVGEVERVVGDHELCLGSAAASRFRVTRADEGATPAGAAVRGRARPSRPPPGRGRTARPWPAPRRRAG